MVVCIFHLCAFKKKSQCKYKKLSQFSLLNILLLFQNEYLAVLLKGLFHLMNILIFQFQT